MFESRYIKLYFSFFILKFFLSFRRMSVHNGISEAFILNFHVVILGVLSTKLIVGVS